MKPILIAEVCQNHMGDRTQLQEMIHAAAENGADYVKTQTIRSSELTHRPRFDLGVTDGDGTVQTIKRPFDAEYERLSKLDLDPEDERWFVEECQRLGVASMTTTFTRAGAREVEDFGYEAVKVASYDCSSYPLLRDLKERWSTIVVSTGSTYDHEIEKAAEILQGTDLTFLHCVTIYPTPISECHLRRMQYLRRFTPKVGWSDHTLVERDGVKAAKIALALGASCIERHFTVLEKDQTKDGPVSIRPEHLKELREFADMSRRDQMSWVNETIPNWQDALGESKRPLSHVELLNRDYYRGRFASKIDGQDVYNWEEVTID